MKKIVALALALGMTTCLFASCGDSTDDTTTTSTIATTTTGDTSTSQTTGNGGTETSSTASSGTTATTIRKDPIQFADDDMVDSVAYGYYCKVLRDETVKNARERLHDLTMQIINADFANKALKDAAQKWLDTYTNAADNDAAAAAYIVELEKSDVPVCKQIVNEKAYLPYSVLATAEVRGLAVSGWKNDRATANIVIDKEYTIRDGAGNPLTTLPILQVGVGQGIVTFQQKVETVEIPVGVVEIEYSAFSQCTNLKSVSLPEGLTTIGRMAFWNCKSLESIVIPDTVTEIGQYAFSDCVNLKTASIPECFKDQVSNIFDGCPNVVITYTK